MRRRLVRATVVVALVAGTTLAVANSTGPPASRTGATPIGGLPAENLCVLCHNAFPPNDGTGLLEILDVPNVYKQGDTVTFRLSLTRPTPVETPMPKWGFQITAANRQRGLGSGTWLPFLAPPEDSQMIMIPGQAGVFRTRRYLEHTATSTRTGQRDHAEWVVRWVAPSTDSGAIYFFAAGNAANGDGASIGTDDHIFTAVDSIVPADTTLVDVPIVPVTFTTLLHAPYPNPMTLCSDMSFEIRRGGRVELAIFDVQGRKVRTLFHGHHDAGPGFAFWDGKREGGIQAKNGVYFVRLMAPDLKRPLVRKVTLAK